MVLNLPFAFPLPNTLISFPQHSSDESDFELLDSAIGENGDIIILDWSPPERNLDYPAHLFHFIRRFYRYSMCFHDNKNASRIIFRAYNAQHRKYLNKFLHLGGVDALICRYANSRGYTFIREIDRIRMGFGAVLYVYFNLKC